MLPTQSDTLLGMAYLIGPGSIGVFMLALYVLARWTASATSYAFLLFPLVAIALGAVLFAEPVQPSFLLGGVVVVAGVYVGAIYRPRAAAVERGPKRQRRPPPRRRRRARRRQGLAGFSESASPVMVVGDQDVDLSHGRARDDERVWHREVGLGPDPGSLACDVVRHVDQTQVAEMAQESLGRREAAGPRRNGRTRISATVIADKRGRVPAGRHECVEQLDCEIGRLLAAGEVCQHDRRIHEDRLSGRNCVASGSRRFVTASRSPVRL